MNENERQLEYPFADALPEPGSFLEVAPGVRWLRMPLPFVLDHINLWLLRDEIEGQAGWTVVDCGIGVQVIKDHWETLFDRHLDGLPVLRVIVTHCHPDHMGLADWICEGGARKRWQARLWTTFGEYTFARMLVEGGDSNAGGPAAAAHFAQHGLNNPETLDTLRARRSYYTDLVPSVPNKYRRVMEGEAVTIGPRTWRVVTGYGHSPEHCALYCADDGLLIAGDMVLPRISTNISVFDMEPEGDPLGLFLKSLERYEAMDAATLVLPSHGKPFRGLHVRIAQLRAHHAARLDEVLAACAQKPASAGDIVPIMFRRQLDTHQITFAYGEAIAHLNMLWLDGRLRRQQDADGVLRFTRAV